MKVGADSVIEIDFTARLLPEGEIVESTRGREVLVVHMGRLEVAPGIERALLGMGTGEEKSIELGPEEGYGAVHPEAIHRRRRSEFPPGAEIKAGMRFAGRLKGSDRRVEFGIREVTDDEVVVDFNHPFAGRRLRYWILVRRVRQPTAGEKEETRRMAEARGRTGEEAQRNAATGATGAAGAAGTAGAAGAAGTAGAAGAAGPAAGPAAGAPPLVSIDDVMRLGLKVGRVAEAVRVAGTDKLLRLSVDLGGETRTIVAGIAAQYAPEALAGRSIIVVTNLKPATIRGVESRGMLLAAVGEGGQPIIASFDRPVPPGAQVR